MSTIDISKGFRNYTPDELRSYAYSGLIYSGNKDLTDFLEYIFTDYKDESKIQTDQDEIEAAREEGYDAGWSEAKREAIHAVENI